MKMRPVIISFDTANHLLSLSSYLEVIADNEENKKLTAVQRDLSKVVLEIMEVATGLKESSLMGVTHDN